MNYDYDDHNTASKQHSKIGSLPVMKMGVCIETRLFIYNSICVFPFYINIVLLYMSIIYKYMFVCLRVFYRGVKVCVHI